MKRYLIFFTFLALAIAAFAQTSKKIEEIKILTSAECGMCKETIERAMAYEPGVVKADLNVETKVLTVKYKPKKTSPEKLKLVVSKTGYDADEVQADAKAYNELNACCKKVAH
jgi:periplasmic mercuric ion binding protein